MKVLLVEDEPGIREGLTDLLSDQAVVIAPERVAEAQRMLGEQRFELVLTDLGMEGDRRAGFRIAEQARARLIPTALLTGAPIERELGLAQLRLQGFLSKPFSVDHAMELLERFVGLGRALDEAAQRGPQASAPSIRWHQLAAGEPLPTAARPLGYGFQIVEGALRFPNGTLGRGERGFVAHGDTGLLVAEGPVRLVSLEVDGR